MHRRFIMSQPAQEEYEFDDDSTVSGASLTSTSTTGGAGKAKQSVKLVELGPRMRLTLMLVETGLFQGDFIFNKQTKDEEKDVMNQRRREKKVEKQEVIEAKKEEEKQIIRQNIRGVLEPVRPVLDPKEILEVQKIVEKIYIDEKIENYIVDIVFATRVPAKFGLNDLQSLISFGASPRASISLALASRAYAFLQGRGYVIPEDVRAVCHDVLRHRIGLTYEAEASNIGSDDIITDILDKVAVP